MLVNAYAISGSIYKKPVVAAVSFLEGIICLRQGGRETYFQLYHFFFNLFEFYTMTDTYYYSKINE